MRYNIIIINKYNVSKIIGKEPELEKVFSDPGFDINKALKHACNYTKATGAGCAIIDSRGEFLGEESIAPGMCAYCRKLQNKFQKKNECANVHLYGSYQAERFGGKYVFFCPMGLVHWASPIVTDKTMRGAFIGGPALMVNPDEFLLDELIRKNGIDEDELREFYKYIKNVPVIQSDVVNSLSELLFVLAADVSRQPQMDKQWEYYKIQSAISEEVHKMKLNDDTSEGSLPSYPFEKEKELLARIKLGDKQASQKILNEILGHIFFSSGKDFNVIKARILELIVLLSRAAVEGGADIEEVFGLNYRYLTDIHSFKTVEDLCFWLSNIMARFTDCVFNLVDVRHKDTIYKALDYIKKNYHKRITLEEVAGQVFLNPSYFSKIFKSEMKTTFVSYVNNIRINAAKRLLADISIPLTDISLMVGFEDQSYFTKVFKKATGVTPGKYRESRI